MKSGLGELEDWCCGATDEVLYFTVLLYIAILSFRKV